MNGSRSFLFVGALAAAVVTGASANSSSGVLRGVGCASVKAAHDSIEVTQDGKSLTLIAHQDNGESRWYEDEQGYAVTLDKSGTYVFALRDAEGELTPSPVPVGAIDPALAGFRTGIQPGVAPQNVKEEPYELKGNSAKPAISPNPNPLVIEQAGQTSQLYFLGVIRKVPWYEDERGYTVTTSRGEGEERLYAYAVRDAAGDLAPTPLLVGAIDPARAGLQKGIRPAAEPQGEPEAPGRSTTRRSDPLRAPGGTR